MNESPGHEMTGAEQPTAGMKPAEGAPEIGRAGAETTPGAGPGTSAADASGSSGSGSGSEWQSAGWRVRDENPRDWVAQLQGMIDSITEQAGPVVREVAAKAAELAAVAAENAGPALHRAGDVATDVGQKVAVRSKGYAAELRRQQADHVGQQGAAEPPEHEGGEPPA